MTFFCSSGMPDEMMLFSAPFAYNIGTLAGILPQSVGKLEGEKMNQVECLHDAYLVIEDGVITEFGIGSSHSTHAR